ARKARKVMKTVCSMTLQSIGVVKARKARKVMKTVCSMTLQSIGVVKARKARKVMKTVCSTALQSVGVREQWGLWEKSVQNMQRQCPKCPK
ncbi:MAG: hypothetical protein WCV67_19950, partial [Victivallaceae bacterium]